MIVPSATRIKSGFGGRVYSGYNGPIMFFVLLCILVVVLLSNHITPDIQGWMMIVGAGWMAGFLDCRMFAKSDRDTARILPPDVRADDGKPVDDSNLFQS